MFADRAKSPPAGPEQVAGGAPQGRISKFDRDQPAAACRFSRYRESDGRVRRLEAAPGNKRRKTPDETSILRYAARRRAIANRFRGGGGEDLLTSSLADQTFPSRESHEFYPTGERLCAETWLPVRFGMNFY